VKRLCFCRKFCRIILRGEFHQQMNVLLGTLENGQIVCPTVAVFGKCKPTGIGTLHAKT